MKEHDANVSSQPNTKVDSQQHHASGSKTKDEVADKISTETKKQNEHADSKLDNNVDFKQPHKASCKTKDNTDNTINVNFFNHMEKAIQDKITDEIGRIKDKERMTLLEQSKKELIKIKVEK